MLRLDHEYHYDLTPEKIDQLVAERRGTEGAEPVRSRQRRSTKGTPPDA